MSYVWVYLHRSYIVMDPLTRGACLGSFSSQNFVLSRDTTCVMILCHLGASVSTIPKSLCDVLGFTNIDERSLNLHLDDSTIKKPLGRINDVLILANRNNVPIDFIVLDIDGNPSSP